VASLPQLQGWVLKLKETQNPGYQSIERKKYPFEGIILAIL
jgi:hypothetical protein